MLACILEEMLSSEVQANASMSAHIFSPLALPPSPTTVCHTPKLLSTVPLHHEHPVCNVAHCISFRDGNEGCRSCSGDFVYVVDEALYFPIRLYRFNGTFKRPYLDDLLISKAIDALTCRIPGSEPTLLMISFHQSVADIADTR